MPNIQEDELTKLLEYLESECIGSDLNGKNHGFNYDKAEEAIRQYAAKAELEGRQHESVYVRQYLNFDVNDPANKRYLTQRWYDLEERIKQLKEGM